jgi:hypothetical protein
MAKAAFSSHPFAIGIQIVKVPSAITLVDLTHLGALFGFIHVNDNIYWTQNESFILN